MRIRHWNTILTAAECKSFAEAAERLYISTPALVAQVNLIERDVGFPIFHRGPRGIELTTAGKRFCSGIKTIDHSLSELLDECESLHKASTSQLRVASFISYTPQYQFEIISQFQKTHSDMTVSLVITDERKILDELLGDRFDLTFFFQSSSFDGNPIVFEPMYDARLFLCMAKEHPLASKMLITASDLENQTVYLPPLYHYSSFGKQVEDAKRNGVQIKINSEDFGETIMLKAQLGQLIVPLPSPLIEKYEKRLAVIPWRDSTDTIGMIYKASNAEKCKPFIDCARQYYKKHPLI